MNIEIRHRRRRLAFGTCSFAMLTITSGQALADASSSAPAGPTSPPAGAESVTQLQDIVVTAQKRSESSLNVPVTVTAISGVQLDHASVDSTTDLQHLVPGLIFSYALNGAVPSIRGVSNTSASPSIENTVATYVDGVYYDALSAGILELNNVQDVEVLKGPQGTLFGRNTTGGVVSITTKQPSQTFSGQLNVGYANYNTPSISAYVTGGITDHLAASLSVYGLDQINGWGTDLSTGRPDDRTQTIAVRTKWLLDIDPKTQATFAFDWENNRGDQGVVYRPFFNTLAFNGLGQKGGFYDSISNPQDSNQVTQYGPSLHVDHDFDFGRLTSITSYRVMDSMLVQNASLSVPSISNEANFSIYSRSFTEELQLSSPQGSPITWIAGLFYLNRDGGYNPQLVLGAGGATLINEKGYQNTESIAGFGQATIPLTFIDQATNFTVGIRYTGDYIHVVGQDLPPKVLPPGTVTDQRTSDAEPSYRFALDHKFSEDVMVYVSDTYGYKGGFYTLSSFPQVYTLPEFLTSYETGLKANLFERRLRVNASFFYYDYKDIQVTSLNSSGASVTSNAGRATMYGLDLDATALLAQGLTVTGGLEWLPKRSYDSYPNCLIYVPLPAGGNSKLTNQNCAGLYLTKSANVSLNGAVDYTVPLSGGGSLGFNVSASYLTPEVLSSDNHEVQPAYALVNAQLRWVLPDTHEQVTLWAKNLTNTHYFLQGADSTAGDLAIVGPPATYGVRFSYNF